jgi:hypothetical protein
MPAWLAPYSSIVTLLTGIPALVYFVFDLVTLRGAKSDAVLFSAVGLELLALFAWIWYREIRTARKYKFHLAVANLHEAIHSLRDLTTYIAERRNSNKDAPLSKTEMEAVQSLCLGHFVRVLDQIVLAYSIVSSGKIRTAIKAIFEHDGKFYVYAFARDTSSFRECKEKDNTRMLERRDPLEENEDFDIIYSNDERCFCDGDISSRDGYRTSSFKTYGAKLSYRSVFVWPIRQGHSPELPLQSRRCLGFLAVDSDRKNAFSRGTDFPIGAAVADALYHPLMLLNKLNTESGNGSGASHG